MLNIKILGSGCANCKRLEQLARKVVEENHLEAEFEKITEMGKILMWPIISTPGLVVNDKVVSSGRIPSEEEIVGWLKSI